MYLEAIIGCTDTGDLAPIACRGVHLAIAVAKPEEDAGGGELVECDQGICTRPASAGIEVAEASYELEVAPRADLVGDVVED